MSGNGVTILWGEPQRARVVELCAALTRDRDAAEDLAQETLLEAWRNREKLHDASGADRWLAAIARNVCLRWARRRGRELPVAPADEAATVIAELDRPELESLLERALSLLPPATRDVLVHHYVDGSSHAEIAARLGVSEAAVSMRISRGRAVLRRLLTAEAGDSPEGEWLDTRVWCTSCGERRLQMKREPNAVSFRCLCSAPGPSAVYDFANPSFARLVGGLVRPTAILKRTAEWSAGYFVGGAGTADCMRCGAAVRLTHYDAERRGLHGRCGACGLEVWSSVVGIAQARPEARELAGTHGRVRTLPPQEISYSGAPATLVRLNTVAGTAGLDVVLARDTLQLLGAH
jgi:RNA polymerase sigma factor (sigma-70 family)